MSDRNYRVMFNGKMVAEKHPEEVAANLAMMFKLDLNKHEHATKLAKLLSGKPVVIKQGLTEEAALHYQKSMAKAGAISTIETGCANDSNRKPHVERRRIQRRKRGDRRTVRRTSAILPDRRKKDRRQACSEEDD